MRQRDLYPRENATASRECEECGLRVTVATLNQNGFGSDHAAWMHWVDLMTAQVPWPLMCEDCKRWWNLKLGMVLERTREARERAA